MEERLESQKVFAGKLLQVFLDRVRLPGGGITDREIVRHPGSVGIVPRDTRGRVVLVRQYRYVTGRELWEIPAGTCDDPGETALGAAQRELAEETGLRAGRWTELGAAYLVPGYGDERMTFFLAEELSPADTVAPGDEAITVSRFGLDGLRGLRQAGEIEDAKTLLGLSWAGLDIWQAPPAPFRG